MKKVLLLGLSIVLFAIPAKALTILDFEGIPMDYWENSGGINLGDYYTGLSFGLDTTILEDQIFGYNSTYYPPHSGHAVLFSGSYPTIRVDFDNFTNHVGFWFTTATSMYLEAYDNSDQQITQSSFSGSNLSSNNFLEVDSNNYNIAYVKIHDSGNFYTIDDFEYEETAPVPEPTTVLLSSLGLLGMGAYIRRKKKAGK